MTIIKILKDFSLLLIILTLFFTLNVLYSNALSLPSSQFSKDSIKGIRCGMCKSLAMELHLEVLRHKLSANGEEEILDSTEAACLGVVRNYTVVGKGKEAKMIHSPEEERMEGGEFNENTLYNAMLVKHVCEIVVEEISMELSETVWQSIQGKKTLNDTAIELCEQRTDICVIYDADVLRKKKREETKKKRLARKARKEKEKDKLNKDNIGEKSDLEKMVEDDGMKEMFRKLNKDGSITNILQQEIESPEMSLPDEEKVLVQRAKNELSCPICIAMFYGAESEARWTPGGRALRSEADLVRIVENICHGPPDLSAGPQAQMLGIRPPNLPPRWTDFYKFSYDEKSNRLNIKSRSKPVKWEKTANKRNWSNKFALEKIVLTEACKSALKTNEDVFTENLFHVLHNHLPSKCLHVKHAEDRDRVQPRGEECTMNPGVLHEACKKIGHCSAEHNSNVPMEENDNDNNVKKKRKKKKKKKKRKKKKGKRKKDEL